MIGMKTRRRLILALSCGVSALSVAHAAAAQEAPATTLNEVVVTAEKRSQNIQNVPAAVSVVSSQFIDQLHATDLEDIGGYVPGLQVTSGGTPGQTTLSLRGIYPVGSGTTVGTYVDDIPVGGSSLYSNAAGFSLDLLPYDLSRIEVLSGPQGTLYGASTLGGLLKYALTTPSLTVSHEQVGGDLSGVSGAGGPGGGARAAINTPLIQDRLGLIASYAFEDTPGYVDDAQTGANHDNALRQQSARLSLLWQVDTRLKIDFDALYQQVQADGNANVALDPTSLQPLFGELKNDNAVPEPFRREISIFSATANYALGWANLTSISSYQYSNVLEAADYTPELGVASGGLSTFDEHLQLAKYTQEVRLASPTGQRIEWQLGSFVTYEHSTLAQAATAQDLTGAPIAGLNPLVTITIPTIYREYAGFGDVTLHVTDRFDVSGGLRYASNTQSYQQITGGTVQAPAVVQGRSSEDVVTYSFSPAYHFTHDIMSYIRIASGYQPGGPNIALPGVPPTVHSDTLTNYEIGLKTQFLQHRATFDIDAFYVDWRNIQVTTETTASAAAPAIQYIANGGTARSEGVEAQGSFTPLPGLVFGGSFAYTDAVLTQDIPSLSALAGDRIPNTPRYSGSVQADYSHAVTAQWTGHVAAGVRLQGDRYSLVNSNPLAYKEPAYGALDMNADLSDGRYTVRIFAKNVTDSRTYNNFSPVESGLTGAVTQVNGTLIQPRTVGLAVDARF